MFKRILVGIDGSETSLRGLKEAVRLAKATGGKLMLVHVVNETLLTIDPTQTYYSQEVIESLRDAGETMLEDAVTLATHCGVDCERTLLESAGGRPADEIVRLAKAWSADLIVLGTHGRRGLKRLALGSDAELVVRRSPAPVLTVRDPAVVASNAVQTRTDDDAARRTQSAPL